MSRRDPRVRMLHMRDYARKAILMASDRTPEHLHKDEMFRLALTHLVELVGEAASQVPSEVRGKYPQIPWQDVVGIRNRLIHGYDYVDYDILWGAVTNNLPPLLAELEAILEAPEGTDNEAEV